MNFELDDNEGTRIKLNEVQQHDTNLFLQKDYNFVQWEQGSGKTITGIAQAEYRLQNNNVRNVFIVSTAISIKNNWIDVLEQFAKPYTVINSIESISKIKQGDYVLITLNMICKYAKQLKKYIKIQSQKVFLVFDESDNISNPYSKRTKSMLSVFRKVKYKTLMTGTSTRNNIAEIAPQIELLYNNSVNMISKCGYIYAYEKKKEGELVEKLNPYYNKPIPAYREGYKLFKESHIPEKITIFGVGQLTQDLYNAEELTDIIDKTILTRTFEEVSGKDLYKIIQDTCIMSDEEKEIYKIAIDEFYKMDYMFSKTGNSRKDAMLKILNQLLLLLKICAAPQTIKEYKGGIPSKFKKVISLLDKWNNERVAIGVRHISVANEYYNEIKKAFPERKIFLITGNSTSLQERKRIVRELENTTNGILISTQQSLSASMNIDFVDKCIIPELHWNNSSMSQYYFRFIRYTSTRKKEVHFITYENSIESNLLKMILVKDKLNLFMKSRDLTDEELYDKFGVDSSLLENLMYKEKVDNEVVIRWGDQKIS